MKAAVLHGLDDIKYEEVIAPEIADSGEVKVKISCCGICRSDVPRVLNGTAHHTPLVLGHEFSGIIEEVGKDVNSLEVGDQVVGVPLIPCMECIDCREGNYSLCKNYSFVGSRRDGGYGEYIVLPETNLVKINKDISPRQAALFETSTIALHGFLVGSFDGKAVKNVAVIGTGTVGLFAVQWARILGAKRIVAFGRSEERLSFAKELGATDTINTEDDGYLEKAMSLTGSRGFDFIIESAGQGATLRQAFSLVANRGKIVLIGTPTDDVSFDWKNWELINRKEASVVGSWMSYSKPFPGKEWEMTKEAMGNGQLIHDDRLFYKILPLSRVREAFDSFKKEKVRGRILLEIDD